MIEFFEHHSQTNSTVYADDFNFNAEQFLIYPVANIEYLESNISGKNNTHSYKIVLGDLIDPNIKGHADEIQSDMMLIAEDFFSWAQDFEGFDFQKSVNIQKFADDTDDRTAGLVFKCQLSTIRAQNTCATPVA